MKRVSFDWSRVAAALMALVVTLAANVASADPAGGGYYDHYGMMGYGGWGGWIFGPFVMLLFFALLVGAVLLIVRLFGGDSLSAKGPRDDKALAILRERFAKGEISQEEFEKAKKALT